MKNILLLVGLALSIQVSAQSLLTTTPPNAIGIEPRHSGLYIESGNWKYSGTAGFLGDEWEFGAHPKDGGVRFSAALWQNDVHLVEAWSLDTFFPSGTVVPGTYVIGSDMNSAGFSANIVHEQAGGTLTSFAADYVQVEVHEAQYKGTDVVSSAVDFLLISTGGEIGVGDQYFYGSFRDNSTGPFNTDPSLVAVPEPATYAVVSGLCLAGFVARRRFLK